MLLIIVVRTFIIRLGTCVFVIRSVGWLCCCFVVSIGGLCCNIVVIVGGGFVSIHGFIEQAIFRCFLGLAF